MLTKLSACCILFASLTQEHGALPVMPLQSTDHGRLLVNKACLLHHDMRLGLKTSSMCPVSAIGALFQITNLAGALQVNEASACGAAVKWLRSCNASVLLDPGGVHDARCLALSCMAPWL